MLRVTRPVRLRRLWHRLRRVAHAVLGRRRKPSWYSRFANPMPGCDHHRTGEHGELSVDLLCLSIDAELALAEPKDR